jgi:hypothetical protein
VTRCGGTRSYPEWVLRRLALVAALALLVVPLARADADPASDILYTQRIYLPFFGQKVSPAAAKTLKQTVDKAWSKGDKIKGALSATRTDLGGIFQLWQKPQTYADVLGRELVFLYKGKLITVMPDGIGVYQFRTNTSKEKALVQKIKVDPTADGIANAATVAVAKLAGLPVPPLPKPRSGGGSGSSSGTPTWQLLVIVGGGVVILALMLILGPRLWRRRQPA